jgi:hypothetical protein
VQRELVEQVVLEVRCTQSELQGDAWQRGCPSGSRSERLLLNRWGNRINPSPARMQKVPG